VIWDFAGERIADGDLVDIARIAGEDTPAPLEHLLHTEELRALKTRARRLLNEKRLPEPRNDRPYPWPLV